MSIITSRTPKYAKLLLSLKPKTHILPSSSLHLATQNPSFDKPPKLDPSSSSSFSPNLALIVDILNSNNNENWKTNEQLSHLLSDSHSLSCNHILQITRRLCNSSIALNFVELLRSNSHCSDANSLSFAFQAVFELAIREPNWKDKLLDLVNTSKELGVSLTVNSVTLLIRRFGRGGMIENSLMLYDDLEPQMRNTHVRNVLIGELLRNWRFDDAFQVLDEMLQPNAIFPPDLNTIVIVFPLLLGANKDERVVYDEEILDLVSGFGRHGVFPSLVMLTQWIDELCRSRRNDMAWKLLYAFMKLDGPVGVVPCNALLTGLAKDGKFKMMKSVMEEMQAKGIFPDVVTLGISINHLCKSLRIDDALNLFEKMRQGDVGGARVEPDVVIYNTLIDGLCKAGRVEEGLAMMKKMVLEGECSPTTVTYNCLIDGFLKAGEFERSLELFNEMEKKGIQQNIVTVNTLVGGMCRYGNTGSALKFYREMQAKGLKGNKVTYTMLIGGFCGVNNISKAMELFSEKKQTCAPDAMVYYTLISGLSQAGLMNDVESVLLEMRNAGFHPDISCYNVMINGFCKKNKLDKAHWLMNEMGKVGLKPDVVTYNTLISYFSKTGDLKTAHRLLEQMVDDNIAPTIITYGTLIHAFCSVGEFDEAMKIFRQMNSSTRTQPDTVIYNILIDSLRQQKKIKGALSLFEEMLGKGVSPNSNTFNALFKGLKDENGLEKAFELMGKMTELACRPDYITMEVLTEWLSAVGEADKLRQFVEGFR